MMVEIYYGVENANGNCFVLILISGDIDSQQSLICNGRKWSAVDIITIFFSRIEILHLSFRFAEFHFSIVRSHAEGNVHLDWVDAIEETPLNVKLKPGFGSSNLTSSLNKSGKSQKLNPKRVGAAWAEKRKVELEMEKRENVTNNFDVNWLPNFGRVWQSGSQKESRKELEVENKNSKKNETQATTSITNSRCSLTSANECKQLQVNDAFGADHVKSILLMALNL
ncbi:coiled coil protein [Actinidia rufa]|uniref:Coiled coil protein n=1 Tax=Actinidia rufa TaxID=165716 RepID=A0A7J0H3K1_9ERIC|nr:coiled coil protein [Actinidia rufa]